MTPAPIPNIELEDPLAYLPHRPLREIPRNDVIYDQADNANGLYLLFRGRVALARRTLTRAEVIVDVIGKEQLFGLGSLVHLEHYMERALALEPCSVMCWTSGDILQQIDRQPWLGVALIQAVGNRISDDLARIQSLTSQTTPERLVQTLMLFSERIGHAESDGSAVLPHLTHKLLSDCIGTSREVVSSQLNRLRRKGYLTYSRRGTTLHRESLQDALRRGLLRESRD